MAHRQDRLSLLRRSAERYCSEAGLSRGDALRDVVWALCDRKTLLLEGGVFWFESSPEGWVRGRFIEQGTLVAAIIFDNAAVAERRDHL